MMQNLGSVVRVPHIEDWVGGFYDLRSAIVHGRHVGPMDFEYRGLSYIHTARLSVEWLVWDLLTRLGLLTAGPSFWGSHPREKALAAQTSNKTKFENIIDFIRREAWSSDEEAMKLVTLMKHLSQYDVKSWEPQLVEKLSRLLTK